ncbi:MAG: type II secretion system GspH family protein [Candidatus Delongbacteria bacterium]|nr:type II secretion system GspH family protein [Candidatus Delongbacteria bacterium]MCG2759978.1 type II secretion system GspH family protein [Candidatus Delongbacteria bacterium]
MKKGFTLIEILVTGVILSLGLVSLLYSYVVCHDQIITNTHRYNATMIINGHFEAIQNQELPANLLDYIAVYSTPQRVSSFSNSQIVQDYDLTIQPGVVVYPAVGSDLTLITATVTWNGGGPKNTLAMTMVSNEPVE